MSSDSDHTYPVTKRKKFIITDSDNSDESIIVQTRRRKTFVCIENLSIKISQSSFAKLNFC